MLSMQRKKKAPPRTETLVLYLKCLSLTGNFLSVLFVFLCVVQAKKGDFDNGSGAAILQMAANMEAQAKEIERLRMEVEKTNLKKKEDIPEVSTAAPEEFSQ